MQAHLFSDYCYNELAEWQFDKLPKVFGCNDWIARKATTCGDLDKVLEELENTEKGAYVEIVMPKLSAPPLVETIHQRI